MKNLSFVFILLLTFKSSSLLGEPTPSPTHPEDPNVAILYTKTGDETEQFENLLDVAKFAIDEYNSVHKRNLKFNLVEVDDHGSADVAEKSLRKMAQTQKPLAIIGPLYSNIALSLKDYVNRTETPMISVFATHNDLTKNSKYIFRICSSNKKLVENLIGHIAPTIEKSKLTVTVFKDLSDSYSTDLADSFRLELEKTDPTAKINEVLFRGMSGVDHLKDINSKVWNPSKKDILLLATQDNISSRILMAMESEPFLVAAIEPVNFVDIIQKIKKSKMHVKLVSTEQWLPGKSALSRTVEADYRRRFHRDLQIPVALTFDAVWSLAEGYRISKEKKIPLVDALRQIKKFSTLTGPAAFGPDGERTQTEAYFKEDILQ